MLFAFICSLNRSSASSCFLTRILLASHVIRYISIESAMILSVSALLYFGRKIFSFDVIVIV